MAEVILDKDQKEVFNAIKNNPNQNFFIQGQAGTGKSTLINYIKNNLGREYAVVAPTGIAAELIGGSTIHSLFKLGGRPYFPLNIVEKYKKYSDVVKRIKTLIIDEASMLRADIFDTIEMLCRKAKQNHEVFGGIQIVLVGDLYQLPPVYKYENSRNDTEEQKKEKLEAKNYIKSTYHNENPFFFDALCYEKGDFKLMKLTIPHRQNKDTDPDFLENLMIVSHNEQDKIEQALKYFNSSVYENMPNEAISIVTSIRKDAEYINKKELEKIKEDVRTYEAITDGDYYDIDKIKEENRKGDPDEILENRKNAIQAPASLELKRGAKVMICKNAPDKSYVNGTIGTIEDFLDDKEEIRVKLDNGNTVEIEKASWEEQEYVIDDSNPTKLKLETIGTFEQFPLKLAYAITIHKSQGQTWDDVCIDLGENGAFSSGQVYVALSRVRTRNGIHLKRKIELSDIKVNPRVHEFLTTGGKAPVIEILPDEAEFESKFQEIQGLKKRISKISYKNTSSWTIYNNELDNDLYLQAGKEDKDKRIYVFKIKGRTYTKDHFVVNDERRYGKKDAQPDPNRRDIIVDLTILKEQLKKDNPVDFSRHLWKTIDFKNKEIIDNPDYQD